MNYRLLGKILGKIMVLEGILMLAPMAVSIIYSEGARNILAFMIPIAALVLIGVLLQHTKPERNFIYFCVWI